MRQARRGRSAQIVAVGDAAAFIRLGNRPSPVTSQRVMALVSALDAMPPPGLLDVIPAYASVLVRFDPLIANQDAMVVFLRDALARASDSPRPRGRSIRIPVCYGGADGPDLDDVASMLGLTPEEVIQRHAAATYRVSFLGFLAGFPYLTGLPSSLAVSRLATPRTRVPAGSVAIAERQAGIYPAESPGGWRILGRTTAPLFDPSCDPPSLLLPGDRVRFDPVAAHEQTAIVTPTQPVIHERDDKHGIPWLRVAQPGIQATVQDRGRFGYARYGVSASGAADPDALALGNVLLANARDAAGLEIAGGDARFEALGASVVVVTGAPCVVRVNSRQMADGITFALAPGDTLELGPALAGMRVYLCIAGGVSVSPVMGSRATDLRAGLGGLAGRAIKAGEVLERYAADDAIAGQVAPPDLMRRITASGEWVLRVLPGAPLSQAPLSSQALDALQRASFTVDARSDRVGVRLRRVDGPCLEGGQVLSEGAPRGAIQLPPDGEPVLLLADAQATGGYRVPAVVASADLWRIGQLRPGDSVRFRLVSRDEAVMALRRLADEIERVSRQPAPGMLLGGFSEWGTDDDE